MRVPGHRWSIFFSDTQKLHVRYLADVAVSAYPPFSIPGGTLKLSVKGYLLSTGMKAGWVPKKKPTLNRHR